MEHAIFTGPLCQPVYNLATVRCTCKQFFFVGVPGYDGNLLVMTLEAIQLRVSFAYIKHFYFLVARASQKPISIDWIPPHLIYYVVVSVNLVDSFASHSWIPQLNVLVFAARKNQRLSRVPIARLNVGAVFSESKFEF